MWSLRVGLFCLAVGTLLREVSSSTEAALLHLQNQHGISLDEVRRFGLTSMDLRELGVEDVGDRVGVLRHAQNTSSVIGQKWQDFTFVVSHFNSTRQFGKCLNFIVKYRYVADASPNSTGHGYIDYRVVRDLALQYAQPTKKLPQQYQWEAVNLAFVNDVMDTYDQVVAVSSQIQVKSEINRWISEPGNHGSVVTMKRAPTDQGSDVTASFDPTDEPWVNAFQYDCVRTNGTVQATKA